MQTRTEQPLSLSHFPAAIREACIRDRQAGAVSVISLSGPLVRGAAVCSLHDRVGELLEQGARELAIDLGEVNEIDSSGLGTLADAYNRVQSVGGKIKFFGVRDRVGRLLQRMHLDTIFELHPTEWSAVVSFGSSASDEQR